MDKLNGLEDLRGLSGWELERLCYEIRSFLIDHVSRTGGHLASNLGAVELTVALHRVFHSPEDSIVWDVRKRPRRLCRRPRLHLGQRRLRHRRRQPPFRQRPYRRRGRRGRGLHRRDDLRGDQQR